MTDAPALTLSPQQRAADVLRRRRELRTEALRRGAELRREATRAAAEDETQWFAEMRAKHGRRPNYLEFLLVEDRKRQRKKIESLSH
jgi:urease accessory protein UreF